MDHSQRDWQSLLSHEEESMMTPATHEYHLNVHAAGKTYSLDVRQAFRFGYTLLRTRKLKEAAQIFEAMTHAETPSRPATIMLAYCRAGLKDYAASSALLCQLFAGENERDKADRLHTAFVYMSVGMWADAIEELAALARQCPELPSVCLLLGDLFALQHKRTKAILCWRMAAKRDHDGGAITAVVRQLVSSQVKPSTGP
jgi:tetratricopeptide (TPR) repeat protein